MKKILLSALGCSLIVIVSCNDGTADNNSDAGSDTTASSTDNSSASNIVTNNSIVLNASQEVPANNSPASGSADVSYNKESKMLTYTVNYKDLTDKAAMAHIHGTAPKGENAGVKHDLTPKLQKETSGSFTDSVKIDAAGIQEDSLLNGFYYFNIHTPKNQAGEIRGQIEF